MWEPEGDHRRNCHYSFSFFYVLIHSFSHSFIHAPIHSHSLIHSSVMHSLAHSLIHPLIHSLIHSLSHLSFIHSFICSLRHTFKGLDTYLRYTHIFFPPGSIYLFIKQILMEGLLCVRRYDPDVEHGRRNGEEWQLTVTPASDVKCQLW